jgi:glycosyltransferase involved in cell wall biosynthesis
MTFAKKPIQRLGTTNHLRATGFRRQPVFAERKEEGLRLSVVIPVHRSARSVGYALDRIGGFLANCPWHTEIIVVDDRSSDSTAAVAASYQGRIPGLVVLRHGKRRGLGAAARTGVLVAKGRHIVVCNVKLRCPLPSLAAISEHLEQGAEIVVASPRQVSSGGLINDKPLFTRMTDTAFRALSELVVPLNVRDASSGMIGLGRLIAQNIAQRARINGSAFDVEWLAMARRFGYHIMELAVGSPEFRGGATSLRGASPGHWRDLCRIRWNLGRDEYEMSFNDRSTLADTRFVRFDRDVLFDRHVA